MPTGYITEWNRERSSGYIESDGRRIFLHIHDFADRRRLPEVGDRVSFVLGADQEGRACAQRAVFAGGGGGFGLVSSILLVVLAVAPGYALYRLSGSFRPAYLAGYAAGISAITFLVYWWDKVRARAHESRGPETLLHLLELLGGWPGAFVAQRLLRHKTAKRVYQFFFWLIVIVHQFVAIDYVRGWPLTSQLFHTLGRLTMRK
jgi:uncharacterized membrane protein YsdA (DUF1294 family)/cold shock CspA family protein